MEVPKHNNSNSGVSKENAIEISIAVIGRSLVGKSALTYRFINDKFPDSHDMTIEDQYRMDITVENIECQLGDLIIIRNN